MKKRIVKGKITALFAALALCLGAHAPALAEFGADAAGAWLDAFAASLAQLAPVNDPQTTADPARAGLYLIEYEFGTVLSSRAGAPDAPVAPDAQEIAEIDVRTDQVTDCRGVRVGMSLEEALGGVPVPEAGGQLAVLSTQESGYGWSWAYTGAQGVYGVEYITYGGEPMTEYTLTYVITDGAVSAIRMRMAGATLAQAQEGLATAEEIAARQGTGDEALVKANGSAMFLPTDLQVMGVDALGVPVASLIAVMGEPDEVQTLPGGAGRMLVYGGAVVQLGLDEATGEEIVRSVSAGGEAIAGPRGLRVGMSLAEAAALFRCDADVGAQGGALYVEGEALGDAPCGMASVGEGGEITLSYACLDADGGEFRLEIGALEGSVVYWYLHDAADAQGV